MYSLSHRGIGVHAAEAQVPNELDHAIRLLADAGAAGLPPGSSRWKARSEIPNVPD